MNSKHTTRIKKNLVTVEAKKFMCDQKIRFELQDSLKKQIKLTKKALNTVGAAEAEIIEGLWPHHLKRSIKFAKYVTKNHI